MYLRDVMRVKMKASLPIAPLLLGTVFVFAVGCASVKRAAVGSFSGEKAIEVFTSDEDPELVRDAFPFGLKTYELLIAEDPENQSLYLAAAAGFVQYAAAFIAEDAARAADEDFARSKELRERAARLYVRGGEYALKGIELEYPRFRELLRKDPEDALSRMWQKDVPFLFLAGAGWVGAISNDPSNMSRVAELSLAEAVMRRVLELDEAYRDGAIQEFFIAFEGGRSEAMGGSVEKARQHYGRAVEITGGKKASPHVALAATVAVREQDLEGFRDLLGKALAVDPYEVKKWRLDNILARRKAQWLLGRVPELFVEYEGETK
jgi:predicted anti-sigma-YlaC factor YlaD